MLCCSLAGTIRNHLELEELYSQVFFINSVLLLYWLEENLSVKDSSSGGTPASKRLGLISADVLPACLANLPPRGPLPAFVLPRPRGKSRKYKRKDGTLWPHSVPLIVAHSSTLEQLENPSTPILLQPHTKDRMNLREVHTRLNWGFQIPPNSYANSRTHIQMKIKRATAEKSKSWRAEAGLLEDASGRTRCSVHHRRFNPEGLLVCQPCSGTDGFKRFFEEKRLIQENYL